MRERLGLLPVPVGGVGELPGRRQLPAGSSARSSGGTAGAAGRSVASTPMARPSWSRRWPWAVSR
ncbi:hypothetical protein MRQ36_03715 [Micromonospora sp. R77]|uniref:hypothetical protein n=1 Tax=Micromonospora sp. R77 TaxID=2925836 RepID=UPI001F607A28|nr:hypothetical protein [Micromonospora sp. R77]MCI4061730.1 hypothetical protein [Micromonospora sp. R77]